MAMSAVAISSSLSWFLAPTEPWVSTLISWPPAAAAFFSASAAMKVWAMPVGQAVIATMRLPGLAAAGLADEAASGAGPRSSAGTAGDAGSLPEAAGAAGKPAAASASSRTASVSRMARLVEVSTMGRFSNGVCSTWMSAARMTTSASAISSSLSASVRPSAPWHSILILWPRIRATLRSASAAIREWAMPVGHAVTPMMFATFWFLLDAQAIRRVDT